MKSRLTWQMGWACKADLDMRKLFDLEKSAGGAITNSGVTGGPSGFRQACTLGAQPGTPGRIIGRGPEGEPDVLLVRWMNKRRRPRSPPQEG